LRSVALNLKISIDGVQEDYFPHEGIFKIGNLSLEESNFIISSTFGELSINRVSFEAFYGTASLSLKEHSIEIFSFGYRIFSGFGQKMSVDKENVKLRLKVSEFVDIDFLSISSCSNCVQTDYLIPRVYGENHYVKLPELRNNNEFLVPSNGIVLKAFSGSEEISCTQIDNKIVKLWNATLRDVYFHVEDITALPAIPPDHNFTISKYLTASIRIVTPDLTGDPIYKVYVKRSSFSAYQLYQNLDHVRPATLPVIIPDILKPYLDESLISKKDYDVKVVSVNIDYSSRNNYWTVGTSLLSAEDNTKIEEIENRIFVLEETIKNDPPVINDFYTTPSSGTETTNFVMFVDAVDPDGDNMKYTFESDIDGVLDITNPINLSVGTHTITLTVNDEEGNTSTATTTTSVTQYTQGQIVLFETSKFYVMPNENFTLSYEWTFSTGDNSAHVYVRSNIENSDGSYLVGHWNTPLTSESDTVSLSQMGTHTITMTLVDGDGTNSDVTQDLLITVTNTSITSVSWYAPPEYIDGNGEVDRNVQGMTATATWNSNVTVTEVEISLLDRLGNYIGNPSYVDPRGYTQNIFTNPSGIATAEFDSFYSGLIPAGNNKLVVRVTDSDGNDIVHMETIVFYSV
jgi:hypothetical protein